MPVRIQRKRTKGWRMPKNTTYVGRGTLFGNPFRIGDMVDIGGLWKRKAESNLTLCWAYKTWYKSNAATQVRNEIKQLKGKNLACWCSLDQPCHADLLLELANG